MRTNPIDITERNRKLVIDLKRRASIAICLLLVLFFFVKILFL